MLKECIIYKNTITVNNKVVYTFDRHETIEAFLIEAYWKFKIAYPKFHKMDVISKLGILTSSILIEKELEPMRTGIILSSNSGCKFTDNLYIREIKEDPYSSNAALFTYTLPSIVMGEICIKHQIQGENMYFITDRFEKQLLHKLAKNMLTYKGMDQCLIGWVEVSNELSYKSHLQIIHRQDI